MTDPVPTCLIFALCAALAALAQNLTGFAFALVLLGLVGLLDVVPVADAANASSILTLVHAAIHFRLHGLTPQWRVMRPALWATPLGVAAGVLLLAWLSAQALSAMQVALGGVIVASSLLLLAKAPRRAAISGRASFVLAGAVSGLMGGLFASPGPPLVLHMHRQPLAPQSIRDCLLLAFAANAALRLVLVGAAGALTLDALVLALAAAPAIAAANLGHRRYGPRGENAQLRWLVAALLMAAGAVLIGGAVGAQVPA